METLRVLVVDDELGMRLGVERSLRNYRIPAVEFHAEIGFEVEPVGTGEEALTRLQAGGIDLLLLDHKLPGIQGLEVLDSITRQGVEVLTVMITAYASIETAISATKRGAYDFLAKPFTPAELKATVHKASRHLMLTRQARRLAREKRQLRFQLISVVSHELKAPLAAIEGYLRLLQNDRVSTDPAQRAHMIDRSLVRLEGMRKLIFDLLDLTRIESGQRQRVFKDTDLRSVAEASIETHAREAAARGITVRLEGPGAILLQADPSELEIVFNNLLSNAVKYNRDQGSVTVTLIDGNETATIRVQDTGIGMSKPERERLFGEFVRIRNRKTQNILGSGLGLSILKRLANLYGGDVAVESEPDVGTTFTVTLAKKAAVPAGPPAAEAEAPAAGPPANPQLAPASGLDG